jgi:peptidoglycan/LPS O-acetylase OafA/YrhL
MSSWWSQLDEPDLRRTLDLCMVATDFVGRICSAAGSQPLINDLYFNLKTMTRTYIPTLDGWRAIAVLLVIGAHSIPMLNNSGTLLGHYLSSIFVHAGLGVDIFFALSGYLICKLLLDEKKFHKKINIKSFYIRRAFRIISPTLLYLLVLILIKLGGFRPDINYFYMGSTILFFRNYVSSGTWYTAHFWSLAVEE